LSSTNEYKGIIVGNGGVNQFNHQHMDDIEVEEEINGDAIELIKIEVSVFFYTKREEGLYLSYFWKGG